MLSVFSDVLSDSVGLPLLYNLHCLIPSVSHYYTTYIVLQLCRIVYRKFFNDMHCHIVYLQKLSFFVFCGRDTDIFSY